MLIFAEAGQEISWPQLITGLGGGLALFLFGMHRMTESLKTLAGEGMKTILAKLTKNRFSALFAGTAVTAILQSSSVTTVLLVGFISAGLLNAGASVGVIIGANVGTTITAQIIAFKVTAFAMLFIALGYLMEVAGKKERIRLSGMMIMGLGLIFFGMDLMSQATGPLRDYPPFIEAMSNISNPIWGIAIGTLFTALVQSSSATTGIVIVLGSQGLINLETGILLVFGANIGTCVTAALSSIGKPREAVKAAVIHTIFNIAGVLLWVAFIPYLASIVGNITPNLSDGSQDIAREVANAHTLFNVVNAFIFIWFTTPLAKLADLIVPKSEAPDPGSGQTAYLDPFYLTSPAVALDRALLETRRLFQATLAIHGEVGRAAVSGDAKELSHLIAQIEGLQSIQADIDHYLGQISLKDLVGDQPKHILALSSLVRHMNNWLDLLNNQLCDQGLHRLRKQIEFSSAYQEAAVHLTQEIQKALSAAWPRSPDEQSAVEFLKKKDMRRLIEESEAAIGDKLRAKQRKGILAYSLELEIIEGLKHIYLLRKLIKKTSSELPTKIELDQPLP